MTQTLPKRITNPDLFMETWEQSLPTLNAAEIKRAMEMAKVHTQIDQGNLNMIWLYDRLLTVCVERGIQ